MSNETKPVNDPEFWKHRLYKAHATGRGVHTAIYDIDLTVWEEIQKECHTLLRKYINTTDKVLDAGCGYGALVSCLHSDIRSVGYHGIDSSPDLIEIARLSYPKAKFDVGDISRMPQFKEGEFDWCICRSLCNMICSNLGNTAWWDIQRELLRVSNRLLLIEYEGEVSYKIVER